MLSKYEWYVWLQEVAFHTVSTSRNVKVFTSLVYTGSYTGHSLSKQERCLVPDLYTVRCCADRSVVSDVDRYVYSRVYARARVDASVKDVDAGVSLIYVHERQTRLYI